MKLKKRGFLLPLCAICNRPVDRLIEDYDALTDTYLLVAICHGQKECVPIDPCTLVTAKSISVGKAFALQPKVGSGSLTSARADVLDHNTAFTHYSPSK